MFFKEHVEFMEEKSHQVLVLMWKGTVHSWHKNRKFDQYQKQYIIKKTNK